VGLNPVLVVHTVGGGHIDALIAALLAAAMAIAVRRPAGTTIRAIALTSLLVGACLLKTVVVPALVLWVCWVVRADRSHRARILTGHLAVIGGLVLASATPFVA